MYNIRKKRGVILFVSLFILTILIVGCDDDRRHAPPPKHPSSHAPKPPSPHAPKYKKSVIIKPCDQNTPAGVVMSFYDEVKNNRLRKAAAYVSPASISNPGTVSKFQTDVKHLQKSNLITVKPVAVQDDYAVVQAIFQNSSDTTQYITKQVRLERANGNWYIIDYD